MGQLCSLPVHSGHPGSSGQAVQRERAGFGVWDDPALTEMGEAEILLDLACDAYAAGHVSRGVAARMAGMDRHAFDQTLSARYIPSYDEERWAQDLSVQRHLEGGR